MKNKFNKKIIAKRIKKLMAETKTKQHELSEESGITRQTISQYVNGNIIPNAERVFYIAKYFNVSSDYLLGLTDSCELYLKFATNGLPDLEKIKHENIENGNKLSEALHHINESNKFIDEVLEKGKIYDRF